MSRTAAGARRGRGGSARPVKVGPWLGLEVEVEIGPVAHGGHCVARHEGRVLFVRHALPGERVVALVTEDRGGGFCRADAIEVRTASPDRVPAPCPHAGPGRCGGCDWQHADAGAQRRLKAAVVREQLTRLAKLPDVPVTVEALPGGPLGWRSRVRFAVDPTGHTALRRHRSHELEPVVHCPLGTDGVTAAGVGERTWPAATEVEVVASGTGDTTVLVRRGPTDGDAWLDGQAAGGTAVSGPARVRERAAGRDWELAAGGFWQVHPAAADTLGRCVLELLAPRPGETALDLYAGAGVFAGLLAEAVGRQGRVVAVESDPQAAADARANLTASGDPATRPGRPATGSPTAAGPSRAAAGVDRGRAPVLVREGRVTAGLLGGLGIRPDVIVLDPPRSGAGPDVVAALLALRPRAVAYVACDPAALARDLRAALDLDWQLAGLRAFDCFPMTQHVETVALLVPA